MDNIYKNKFVHGSVIFFLFLFSFGYFLYDYRFLNFRTYLYDEGINAYGALCVLKGKVPYRDFWTLYSPGVFYFLALGFKLFGISLHTQRILTGFILALTVTGIYVFIKRLSSFVYALLGFLLATLWLKSYMVYLRPGQIAVLFSILCSLTLLNYIRNKKIIWIFLTGILNGLVILFRQDFGVYTFIAISLFILEKNQKDYKIIRREYFYLTLGILITILPIIIYFIWQKTIFEMVYYIIIFPLVIYPKVRNLPFPELKINNIIFYLPIFIFLFGCFRLLFYKRLKYTDEKSIFILFYLSLGMGLFFYTSIRTFISHLLPTMIPVIIISIFLLEEFLNKMVSKIIIFKRTIIAFIFILIFILFYREIKPIYLKFLQFKKGINLLKIDLKRAKGFYDDPEFTYSQILAIKYIQELTKPDEKIFVGNIRHDKVLNNDVLFYFLSERDSATKYFEIHPGLTNTYSIQKRIIEDLEKNNVNYIVLWDDPIKVNEPNESNKSSRIFLLDNYIHNNYRVIKIINDYTILKRIVAINGK